ncbi:MAG TPA: IS110 family transposase, partial [Terriglobales bacterium]|nr:IS110 family transposase [Terriglobales bacterium]
MVLLSPFPSLVPSFVIETVVTGLCCTAAIPMRRLPERRRLGPPRDLGEKSMSRKSSKQQKRAGQGGAVPSLNITSCDQEIEQPLQNFDRQLAPDAPALPPEAYPHARRKNEFRFDMRSELYRIFGVDLTAIPSINALTGYTLLAEVGTDWSKFRNLQAFASWACLCPQNKKSGGKVLSAKTRRSANRVNRALRLAAQTLERSTSYLGIFYRK